MVESSKVPGPAVVVLRRESDGSFVLPSEVPEWLDHVLSEATRTATDRARFDDSLEFLGSFVKSAELAWAEARKQRSGIFAVAWDDDKLYVEATATTVASGPCLVLELCGTMRGNRTMAAVRELRRTRLALSESEASLERQLARNDEEQHLLASLSVLILRLAADGTVLEARGNPDYELAEGRRPAEGMQLRELLPTQYGERSAELLDVVSTRRRSVSFEFAVVFAGRRQEHFLELHSSLDAEIVAVFRNVTEERALEGYLRGITLEDRLTGLANRHLLEDRVGGALDRALRAASGVWILHVDLDDFARINTEHGHAVGDGLLVQCADRLRAVLRRSDTIVRRGGDDFVVVVEEVPDVEAAEGLARKLLYALSETSFVHGRELRVTASIGLSCYPSDGSSPEELTVAAEAALHLAKGDGGNSYAFASGERQARRLRFELDELRFAPERKEFAIHYEPVLDTRSGRVVDLAADLRWQHPREGSLPAHEFMAVAASLGFSRDLDEHGLEHVLSELPEVIEAFGEGRVWLGLAGASLQGSNFVDRVEAMLQASPDTCARLGIALRAPGASVEDRAVERFVRVVRPLGVRLAMTEFGVENPRLRRLHELAFERIELAASRVRAARQDKLDHRMLEALFGVANGSGASVCAAGVDEAQDRERLRELGCDLQRGQLFAEAVPLGGLAELLRRFAR